MTGTKGKPKAASQRPRGRWTWLLSLLLILWLGQVLFLAWQVRGEAGDLFRRLGRRSWGEAVRLEEPFYRWLVEFQRLAPPDAIYVFLDNYEAGKEIEARYHLFPRRHHLNLPGVSPARLFHTLRQEQASFLLVREAKGPSAPGLQALMELGAAKRLNLSGPGAVYRLDIAAIVGGFYD